MAPVSYTLQDSIAIIAMDDGKANALSYTMMDAIEEALSRAKNEASAVILTGRAGRFSAGFDLQEMMSGIDNARRLVGRGAKFLLELYALPLPLVIACSGHALAGGALTVLTGDVRIGVKGAFKVGLNEVQIGMPVPILAMELARDRIVPPHLIEATLFATICDPEKAVAWGYLDKVVEPERLVEEAMAEATRLSAFAKNPYSRTKLALREKTINYVKATLEEDLQRLTALS